MTEEEFNQLNVGDIVITNQAIQNAWGDVIPTGVIGIIKRYFRPMDSSVARIHAQFWGMDLEWKIYADEVDKYNG